MAYGSGCSVGARHHSSIRARIVARPRALALAAVAFTFGARAQTVTGIAGYQLPVVSDSAPNDQAFHAGGVGSCDGCHLMHNASNGVAKSTVDASGASPWTNTTNPYLLQGADQTSTCLACHAGVLAEGKQFTVADLVNATAPRNRTPGGDFGWVKIAFGVTSPAARHGHNVVAVDFGLDVDPDLQVAPGGTFRGATSGLGKFACTSCHDPHGRYRMQVGAGGTVVFAGPFSGSPTELPIAASGSYGAEPTTDYSVGAYRLLAGQLYAPASNATYPFSHDPPIAIAPMKYNASETIAEVRVAYGTGMSEWCQNCHTNIHLNTYVSAAQGQEMRHPAGSSARLKPAQYDLYNKYVSSGVIDQNSTNRYLSLVPFEQGSDVAIATLKAGTAPDATITAGASSNVMCLSCHRAHASAFDSMIRWDQAATFLTDARQYTAGLTTRTLDQTMAGYYERPVGTDAPTAIGRYQRSLCNKCHGMD